MKRLLVLVAPIVGALLLSAGLVAPAQASPGLPDARLARDLALLAQTADARVVASAATGAVVPSALPAPIANAIAAFQRVNRELHVQRVASLTVEQQDAMVVVTDRITAALRDAQARGVELMYPASFPPDVLGKAFKAVGAAALVAGAGLATIAAVAACPVTGITCPVAAITGGFLLMAGTALVAGADIADESAQDAQDAANYAIYTATHVGDPTDPRTIYCAFWHGPGDCPGPGL